MILNAGTGNGNQLLKPETVAEMIRKQMGDIRVVRPAAWRGGPAHGVTRDVDVWVE